MLVINLFKPQNAAAAGPRSVESMKLSAWGPPPRGPHARPGLGYWAHLAFVFSAIPRLTCEVEWVLGHYEAAEGQPVWDCEQRPASGSRMHRLGIDAVGGGVFDKLVNIPFQRAGFFSFFLNPNCLTPDQRMGGAEHPSISRAGLARGRCSAPLPFTPLYGSAKKAATEVLTRSSPGNSVDARSCQRVAKPRANIETDLLSAAEHSRG